MPVPQQSQPEPLTDAGRDSLTDYLEDYVRDGLEDLNYAVQDLPAFIADPTPPVLAAAYPKGVLRAACRSYARGSGPQNLPGFDAVWGGLCRPYLDDIGETPEDGFLGLPFEGGQCDAVYLVTATRTTNLSGTSNITLRARGPVGGVRVRQVLGNNYDWELFCSGLNAGASNCGPLAASAPGWYRIGGVNSSDGEVSASILSVVPCGADNCGNPPPIYDPPKIKPGLPEAPRVPVDIPGVGPVDIDVRFEPDGTIVVELPDIGIEVPISDPFGFGDGGGGGAPPGPPPGDVGQPGLPGDTGNGGDAAGEAPPGSELVGLKVDILQRPGNPVRYTEEVDRGVCYVYMGVPGLLDQDFGGSMVRSGQFLFAEKQGLTAWRVSANNNYSLRITPYYREVD